MAGVGCVAPQQSFASDEVHDRIPLIGPSVHPEGRLADFSGPSGQTLSSADTSLITQIPEVRLRRNCVSIQSHMFRAVHSPSGVHQGLWFHSQCFAFRGDLSLPLPR